jgi:hypothetical protein|tara:strand:- start:247 stop:468 length:222 start_codon:yes stop_codon:yes gene_type:complete
MTKKKLKCPKCKTEDESDLTVWMKGEVGYTVFFDGDDIAANDESYYELHFETISCQCGYESENQSDFIVDVRE